MYKKTLAMIGLAAFAAMSFGQVRFYSDGRPEKIFKPVSGLDPQDMKFLRQAIAADSFEIMSSKLALQNGSGEFVKEYAKEMIDDHKAAKIEAVETAEKKGLNADTNMPDALQAKLNHLQNLNGWQFNQAYEAAQKAGHEATIQAFETEINNGHDQLVKAMAVKELPTIKLHYKMLLDKKTMMGPTAANHGI
jgi:putative membrane protein